MKLIFKSYIKTFFKNIFITVGTLIFIIMLITSVVGMLSPSVQTNAKAKAIESKINKYDYKISEEGISDDLLYHYFYNYKNTNDFSNAEIINQKLMNYVIKNNEETDEDENPIFSKLYNKDLNWIAPSEDENSALYKNFGSGNANFGNKVLMGEDGFSDFKSSDNTTDTTNLKKTQNFTSTYRINSSTGYYKLSSKFLEDESSITSKINLLSSDLKNAVKAPISQNILKSIFLSIESPKDSENSAELDLHKSSPTNITNFKEYLTDAFYNGVLNFLDAYNLSWQNDENESDELIKAIKEYFSIMATSGQYFSISEIQPNDSSDEIDIKLTGSVYSSNNQNLDSTWLKDYNILLDDKFKSLPKNSNISKENLKNWISNLLFGEENSMGDSNKSSKEKDSGIINKIINLDKNSGDNKNTLVINFSPLELVNNSFFKLLKNEYNYSFNHLIFEDSKKFNDIKEDVYLDKENDKYNEEINISTSSSTNSKNDLNAYLSSAESVIDNTVITSGRNVKSDDEVVISPAYAKYNNIKIGDSINLPALFNKNYFNEQSNNLFSEKQKDASSIWTEDNEKLIQGSSSSDFDFSKDLITQKYFESETYEKYFKKISLKVVGLGLKSDDVFSQSSSSASNSATSFSDSDYKKNAFLYVSSNFLKEAYDLGFHFSFGNNSNNENKFYFYSYSFKMKMAGDKKIDLNNIFSSSLYSSNFDTSGKEHKIYLFESLNSPFSSWSSNKLEKNLKNILIQLIIYIVLSGVAIFLSFTFLNFVIKKELNETRVQLGIFKSMGCKTTELSWIFAIKTFLNIFIGIIVGFLCSIPFQIFVGKQTVQKLAFEYDNVYLAPFFMIIIFIIVPLIFLIISYILTLIYLKEETLSLMKNGSKIKSKKVRRKLIVKLFEKRNFAFTYRTRVAFVSRAKGKFYLTQFLFGISALLFALLLGARVIILQTINEGFAMINDNTDHYYSWTDKTSMTDETKTKSFVDSDELKFTTSEKITSDDDWKYNSMDYTPYIGENIDNYLKTTYLNENDYDSPLKFSYSRYGLEALMDGMNDNLNNLRSNKDGFLSYLTGIPIGNNISSSSLLIDALTYNILPDNSNEEKYNNFIEENYLKNNNHVSYDDLSNLSKVDLTANNDEDNDLFSNALLGMQTFNEITTEDKDGNKKTYEQYNNFYLKDLAKFLSIILMQIHIMSDVSDVYSNESETDKKDISKLISDIKEKLKNDEIITNYDLDNPNYWSIKNNPLINFSISTDSNVNVFKQSVNQEVSGIKTKLYGSPLMDSANSSFEIFSNVSSDLLELLFEALMMKSDSSDYNPIVTLNSLLFNNEKESLDMEIPVALDLDKNPDEIITSDSDAISLDLIDTTLKYGDQRKQMNYSSVTDDSFESLSKQNSDGSFNAIVPYVIAKKMNLHMGDKISLRAKTNKDYLPFDIRIAAINSSQKFATISDNFLFEVDYSLFAKKQFDSSLIKHIFNVSTDDEVEKIREDNKGEYKIVKPIFNHLWSNMPSLEGSIKVDDISSSFNSLEFVGNQVSLNQAQQSNVFGSLMNIVVSPIDKIVSNLLSDHPEINIPYDGIYDFIEQRWGLDIQNNDNFSVISSVGIKNHKSMGSIKLLKSAINDLSTKITLSLIIFIMLQSILLIIIITIIMNIIVDEYTLIILTFKSLGYSRRKINWIVMGSYINGVIISYIVSYIFTVIIWQVVAAMVAKKYDFYLTIGFDWKTLLITGFALAIIMFIGWASSDWRVNRKKLTQITNV